MYINAKLQTCSRQFPGGVLLTDELSAKLKEFRPFAKAVLDADGNLIDIEHDDEAAAEYEAEKTEQEQEQEQKQQLKEIRQQRKKLLTAFDTYKSNLLYFGGTETEEEHAEIAEWYSSLLAAAETGVLPETPAAVQQYL